MDYFAIADTEICINTPRQFPAGEYLEKFRILRKQYDVIQKDRISVVLSEKVMSLPENVVDAGNYFISEKCGSICLYVPYGHCRCAIHFSPSDWRNNSICVKWNPSVNEEPNFTLNQLLSITGLHSPLLARGGLTVHASYIETGDGVNRQAVLFIGPSGMGKSTQAELWSRFADARIINGDRAVVRREKDGWKAHGIPVCGSSQICENESLPIRIIIVLAQGIENRVEEIKEGEKYRALLLASAFYQWDAYESEKVHELITELISEVPIIRLVCRPDKGAVRTVQKYIAQDSITQKRKSRG